MLNKKVLVTGGAGYIGSHMTRVLLANGYQPVVFDNLSTGYRSFIPKGAIFVKGDLRKKQDIAKLFAQYQFSAVIHFAGLIVVPESVKEPGKYYENNVVGSLNLLDQVAHSKVRQFIFSSTAAVYGSFKKMPLVEGYPTLPINPYAQTKLMVENAIKDYASAYNFKYMILRYFNVAGAYPTAEVGEAHDPETHLIPNVLRAAKSFKGALDVYGDGYDTKDGTCVRDYIHVMDLCLGHLLALKALSRGVKSDTVNLGTSKGSSVYEIIETIKAVTGKTFKVNLKAPRAGDAAIVVASYKKALKVLGWRPLRTLKETIASAWEWESKAVKLK